MRNLGWGLETTALGMGMVFLLLIILMGVLAVVGRLDGPRCRAQVPPPDSRGEDGVSPGQAVEIEDPSGLSEEELSEEELAAVAVAVAEHARTRRRQGAPGSRAEPPRSRLSASRWVSAGRSSQMRSTGRR